MKEDSYFDGDLLQLVGYKIVGFFVTVFTADICYPWAFTMIYAWKSKHTVVEGKRLECTGSAVGLLVIG